MKTRWAVWFLVLCAALLLSASPVGATSINGSIGFTGTYTQNGGTLGDLSTATSMTITNAAIAPFSDTGDLAGAVFVSFFSPIGVNVNSTDLIGNTLWTVTVGATTFTFDVTTESQTFTSPSQLNLEGSGVLHASGFDDTNGIWQLGFGRSGASFTWQATSATVPEPSTLLLLGSGLVGLIGRKLRK